MTDYSIDWNHTDIDGNNTLHGVDGDIGVHISTPENSEHNSFYVGDAGGNGSQELVAHCASEPVSVKATFDDPVENVTFEIFDIDSGDGKWDDRVTVIALDADGNPVEINISDLTHHHLTDNADGSVRIDATSSSSNGVEESGADDTVSVSIPGPLSYLEIVFDNGSGSHTAGTIGVSDLHFDAADVLDGTVNGTAGDDLIDLNYDEDPEGDKIDNNDAIVAGEGPQDDIVRAGAGDDTVVAGEGDDDVRGEDGNDKIYGGEGDDSLSGDAGNDMVFGGADSDLIKGGDGNDMLIGGGPSFDGKLDFNDLSAGDIVGGQYAGNGVTISSGSDANPIMIFDTANPTGGDHDLATHNLGNVLILSEDGDSSDPDDNAGGGTFIFDFDSPAHVESLDFLDIEGGAWIKLYDEHGNKIGQIDTAKTADNGQLSQHIGVDGVARMEVIITGSGAIDNLCYKLDGSDGDAADTIFGGAGDDYIDGQLGDDSINGGTGNDTMLGGEGDDRIFGNDGNDLGFGGAGNDVMGGADRGDDEYYGGAGDDMMETSFGDDTLYGGAGNDNLWASSDDDLVFGGKGDDSSFGGHGQDTVFGEMGDDTLSGGSNTDTIFGGSGNDVIDGDKLYKDDTGAGGADTIYGGGDDDKIDGGAGNDILIGDGGPGETIPFTVDWDILGSDGHAAFTECEKTVNVNINTPQNAEGKEWFVENGMLKLWDVREPATADIHFDLPVENVTFTLLDVDALDKVTIWAKDADGNLVEVSFEDTGVHAIDGNMVTGTQTNNPGPGADNDSQDIDVTIAGPIKHLWIVLDNGPERDYSGTVAVTDIKFDLPMVQVDGDDMIDGGEGDDYIEGNGGDDMLTGGVGNDTLKGGDGDDSIGGGDGDDMIFAGNGNDVVEGGDGNDKIEASRGEDTVFGGAGDDDIWGGKGNDTLFGGEGADSINGGNDADVIFGGAGDVVDGGAGGDDFDVLDLTGKGPFVLTGPGGVGDPVPDSNGNGLDGQVQFIDADGNPTGEVIDFTEIEEIIGELVENRGPDAVDDGFSAGEDDDPADLGNVLDNDSDLDGDTLTVGAVNGDPANVGQPVAGDNGGLITINPDGTISFDPNGDFEALGEGEETTTTVTYLVDDGQGGTEEATVTITVTGVNDAPDAVDNAYTFDQSEAAGDVDGNVLSDNTGDGVDSDPEGDAIRVASVSNGTDTASVADPFGPFGQPMTVAGDNGGLVTINNGGNVDFDANGEFDFLGEGETATTSVTYTIVDENGAEDTATVTFTVTGTNDAPVAVMDSFGAGEDDPAGVVGNVLDNDSDPDGDPLTVSEVNGDPAGVGTPVAGDNGGLVTINPDGTVTFDPDGAFDELGEGETAKTSVTYTVSDGNGGVDTQTVMITVTGTNDAPVAVMDTDATDQDTAITLDNVLGNDTDPENDVLTVSEVNGDPTDVGAPVAGDNGGLFTINEDGTASFDPNGEFDDLGEGETAETTVTYTVTDPDGATDTTTVTVTVTGTNDGPVAVDDTYTAGEDSVVDLGNVTDNDEDPDNDPLTVDSVNGDPANVGEPVAADNGGLGTINPDGSVSFDPNGEFDALAEGEETTTSVVYTVTDPSGETSEATVTITVTGTNDAPEAVRNDYTAALDEGFGDVDGNVLTDDTGDGVDSDPEGDTLTVSAVAGTPGNVGVAVAGSAGGLFIINADGTVDFDANGDFDDLGLNDSRTTEVEYTITDENGATDTAVVTFTVSGINDGTVQGTMGDDIINPDIPYVDADGDIVDGNDAILPGDTGNDDLILGMGGNDSIDAGDGDDRVFGGADNDTIEGGEGNDLLVGGDGNDSIDGEDGDDRIFGGEGDDTLRGGAGNDLVEGSGGDDELFGDDGDDDMWGGTGNDLVEGGDGNDTIGGGSGDDTLKGQAGDDTLFGDSGNDVIEGNQGDDVIDGSFGDDSIEGGQGNDVIEGGNGDDVINAGNHVDPAIDNPYPGFGAPDAFPNNDLDTVFGGSGDDTITTGDDDDSVDGGTGNDFIDVGIDDDSVTGGVGNDTIIGSQGSDNIEGNEGNDLIYGGLQVDVLDLPDRNPDGSQNDLLPDDNIDTIKGGDGNDTIFGRDDADLLFGGDGNDVIDGGVDNDEITGGDGVDQLFGGQGDDTFFGGNGGDVVVGGEDEAPAGATEGIDVDVLDLTGSNVDRIEYVPGDPEAGTVFFTDGTTMTFSEIENVIPCFTPGTTIATPRGERLVEELQVGDKVITRDNGIQEIAWVGHKAMDGKKLAANPHLKPILIKAGSLGGGLPERDMLVSPNHRVLVASEKTQLYFEEREVLAAAKHMTGAEGIHSVNVMNTTYVHFMFERHEVVLSNGAWTESFQPGDYSLKGIGNSQRNEIFELFPELSTKTGLENYQAARKALKKHEARLLMM